MKNNTDLKITIIVVILLLLIVGGSLLYKNTFVSNYEKISREELEKIVTDEMYIFGGKKDISELSNKEKLWFAFRKSIEDFPDNFKAAIIEDSFKNTSLSNLGIDLENIGYYSTNNVQYLYNADTKEYSLNPEYGATGYTMVKPAYTKTIGFTNNDGKYTIIVKYLWYKDEPAQGYVNVYGTYEDAVNSTNALNEEEIASYEISNEDAKKYLEKEGIETYKYTFKKENGKINFIKFEVK